MNTNLREAVGKYLNLRRSLGYKLVNTEYWLKGFLEFLEHQQADHVTTRLALEWARLPKAAQPAYWSGRLSAVRLFAQYRQMEDPRTEIPPQRLLSQRTHRTIPYIYSKKEVHRLVEPTFRIFGGGSSIFLRRPAELHRGVNRAAVGDVY